MEKDPSEDRANTYFLGPSKIMKMWGASLKCHWEFQDSKYNVPKHAQGSSEHWACPGCSQWAASTGRV